MESTKTVLLGKPVFLLTGVKGERARERVAIEIEDVEAPENLIAVARRNPDACAFGYVSGSWFAAA